MRLWHCVSLQARDEYNPTIVGRGSCKRDGPMPVQVGSQMTCGLDMTRVESVMTMMGDDELTRWSERERSNGSSWVGNVGLLEVMRGDLKEREGGDDGG